MRPVLQTEATECSLASMATVAQFDRSPGIRAMFHEETLKGSPAAAT